MVTPQTSPSITVIIATYNSSQTLRLTLSSLLNQSFLDWEAWIVGDGCTDDTEKAVRSFDDSRLHWTDLGRNHGSQALPNNEGLRRARGQYVAYLGHDDLWMPHHLLALVRRMEETGAAFAHSLGARILPEGVAGCFGPPGGHRGYAHHFVPPSCWLHHRTLVDRVGYWGDPDALAWPVDTDNLLRVSRSGASIVCCRQLSLLKFPSARFRIYSHVGEPPQAQYWRRMQADARDLEHDLLLSMAETLARRQPGDDTIKHAWKLMLHTVKRSLRRSTGELPLFRTLWKRRFQEGRRLQRRHRGLPG